MKSISRRHFLQRTGAVVGYTSAAGHLGRLSTLSAQTPAIATDYKALVCVFLAGGCDTNNLLVPLQTKIQDYTAYQAVRGTKFGISSNLLIPITAVSGEVYGLHPQLAPIAGLYSQGQLAVVSNVGTLLAPSSASGIKSKQMPVPVNLYSHSDQQQQWQTAQSANLGGTGWGGRAIDALQPTYGGGITPNGLSVNGKSLFLRGAKTSPGEVGLQIPVLEGSDHGSRDLAQQQLLSLNSGLSLVQSANQTVSAAINFGSALNTALSQSSGLKTVFPATAIGAQLKQVATLIKARAALGSNRQIFAVSMGGFDLHSGQASNEFALLSRVADGLLAFNQALQEIGIPDQVLTFTESEFGRTFQPNSTGGSDHAWGSHQLVMGGALTASDVYGTYPQLTLNGPDDITGRGVWVPSASLDQYGATIASWFGVPPASMPAVFPNLSRFATNNLGFI